MAWLRLSGIKQVNTARTPPSSCRPNLREILGQKDRASLAFPPRARAPAAPWVHLSHPRVQIATDKYLMCTASEERC